MQHLLALLEWSDFALIAAIVAVLAGGATAAGGAFRPRDRERLARVEEKLDLLLAHAGIEYVPAPKAAWQELADKGCGSKIAAIKVYREETGVGLAEAKRAVEDYMAGREG
jgi:ribosomal protein L7/L12